MTKTLTNRIIKLAGVFLTIIALFFLFKSIWGQREFLFSVSLPTISKIVVVGSFAYFIADVILAIAWKMLLNWFGDDHLSLAKSIRIYGRSQILKYIPGNLLSIPGRHILSVQHGAEHGPLVGAAAFEIIGLLAMSSTVSIFGILFSGEESITLSLWVVFVIFLLSLASPLILRYVMVHQAVIKKNLIFKSVHWGNYRHLISIWLLYLGFFMITGFILFGITRVLLGRVETIPYPAVFSIFATSWFLGTITPGAPAGVGIRESIIILLLSGYLGEQTSILVSLLMRIITMLGDFIFYFGSLSFEQSSSETV